MQTLVIGYGNRLRGDDGVGPAAGDIVESWRVPGVKVLIAQQLVPEMIDDMKDADRVLFIDAAREVSDGAFVSSIVEPKWAGRSLGHHETPGNLLALLYDLEACAPEAWLLTISAVSFDHGERITASAADNVQAALGWICGWLGLPCLSR